MSSERAGGVERRVEKRFETRSSWKFFSSILNYEIRMKNNFEFEVQRGGMKFMSSSQQLCMEDFELWYLRNAKQDQVSDDQK